MNNAGVIVFLIFAISVSPEVYDVTTVYRIAGNLTPIADDHYNSDLVCDDDTCDWSKNGWRQFEAMSDAKGTELYSRNEKLLFPLHLKKFGISFSILDTDKVFIYLLPEDDINALNMTIIVLKYTHDSKQAYSEVLSCPDNEDTDTLYAVKLPDGNSRQCRTLSELKVIPYLKDYNLYFIRSSTRPVHFKIYLQSEDGTNLETLYSGHPKEFAFIAIQSTGSTKFSVKSTYRVTKLSKLTGTLRSPIQEIPRGQAYCITLSYYLEARSNISLHVYVEQNEKKLTEIGAVRLKDVPQDISRIHQFIWYPTDDFSLKMRYKIEATRGSENDIVLIRKISGCHNAGFANITTVNTEGSCEVQGRSNALGLPLQSSENVVMSHNLNSILPECYLGVVCDWESNWIRRNASDAPLYTPSQTIKWEYQDGITPAVDFIGRMQIEYVPYNYEYQRQYNSNPNYVFYIFLLDNAADIGSSNMYVIKLQINRYSYVENYVVKCFHSSMFTRDSQIKDFAGHERWCEYVWRKDQMLSYWQIQNIMLTLSGSQLEIGDILGVEIANSSQISKVCFESSKGGTFTLLQDVPVAWTLPNGQGILRSPTFITTDSDSDKICASVTYYLDDISELHLQLETVHQEILDVVNFSSRNSWITERKILKLPKENEENEIQIVLVGKNYNEGKIMVQRIASCNPEEQADIVMLSNEDPLDITENVYHVAIRQNSEAEESNESKQCINGGIFDAVNQGCVCPAGFGGPTCEIGCGINTFGASCDGICSETLKGCKEMIFCHAKLGCNCATGLQGALCSSTCEPGYYGAGCRQKCGNCKSSNSACNIYTGHCFSGCLEGYYPPFCKEHYKHFTRAPETLEINSDNVTVTVNFAYTSGKGRPLFYQFQYIESDHLDDERAVWLEQEPLVVPECEEVECVVTGHIRGLKQGKKYQIRAILLDEDGSSYQGQNIPQLTVTTTTNCIVPKKLDYKLRADYITESSFYVLWEYTPKAKWCSLKTFVVEFKESSRWTRYYQGTEQYAVFTDMWYGREYKIRIRAIFAADAAAYSDILVVKTKEEENTPRGVTAVVDQEPMMEQVAPEICFLFAKYTPDEVREIKVTSVGSKTVSLQWTPLLTGGLIKHYVISYKCLKLLACKEEDCSYFSGEVTSSSNSITIGNLISFAQYSISVAAFGTTLGPAKHVLAATAITEPQVTPGNSSNAVLSRRNTTVTVQWEPPHNCSHINGFLHGYLYELVENPMAESLVTGFSYITSATFSNLTPLTEYTVKVFAINSVGWNPLYPLIIKGTTSATTPDMVRNLTVYKQGRRMIGFRWNVPKRLYGDLDSFTASYQMSVPGSRPVATVVKPTPCPAWPKLYCHTFSRLQPDSEYTITVSARNSEVNEDGEPANVTALTKEKAPAEPLYLKVVAANETSITLEWGLPDMINGLLRSFLLSVEGTDSYHSDECCQYLPLQEVPVFKEEPSYQFQVTGLQPASSYSVSVSGKTVSLGPSVSISAHTRPALPKLDDIIKLGSEFVGKSMPVIIKPVTENKDLVSAYLLIVIPENVENVPLSMITDEWLNETITEELDYTHYVAGEYTQEDLEQSPEVHIGTGSLMHIGKFSTTQDPELQNGTDYSLAVAVVLDYCGVKNVGISITSTFRIEF